MIIYSATKRDFINDVKLNQIDDKVLDSFVRETGYRTGIREINSWRNSLPYMRNIVDDSEIPEDAGIAIEYTIPQTSKRIDFVITGLDSNKKKNVVIIELKQWESVEMTNMDGVVKTFVGGGIREVSHPSYQVWSYATFLEDYNSSIQDGNIDLEPCAYLHNYVEDSIINNDFYKEYIKKAPLFFRSDVQKLQNFIKRHIKYGDPSILYEIENGKIRPSKALADSLAAMLDGNKEFVLLDDQKIVYEKALEMARLATPKDKKVLIVQGGPGTGKSVVAINLLSELTNKKMVAQYITRNSAPRNVFEAKLTGKMRPTRFRNLFKGSGGYHNLDSNVIDAAIVDEAHRLNEQGGFYGTEGENQIKEIMMASKFSIFFVDENQKVTIKDIGDAETIQEWADNLNIKSELMELASQFRCNGSDGYLAWLDNILQINETANYSLKDIDYDFQVFDNPKELHDKIIELNKKNNKSRVVAGYTWKWLSKREPSLYDIEIGNYKARWNLTQHGQAWIIHPESVFEIGCIHTCQGLELDYVGVIIGSDLIVRNGEIITDYKNRAVTDQSLKGIKKIAKEKGEKHAQKIAEPIIKNTYRTLMTRGMKGCFIYSEDQETREYFERCFKGDFDLYSDISSGSSIM